MSSWLLATCGWHDCEINGWHDRAQATGFRHLAAGMIMLIRNKQRASGNLQLA